MIIGTIFPTPKTRRAHDLIRAYALRKTLDKGHMVEVVQGKETVHFGYVTVFDFQSRKFAFIFSSVIFSNSAMSYTF